MITMTKNLVLTGENHLLVSYAKAMANGKNSRILSAVFNFADNCTNNKSSITLRNLKSDADKVEANVIN